MKTLLEKYEIIDLKRKGWSNTQIQNTFGVSRNTVSKYWREYQAALETLTDNPSELDTRKILEEVIVKPKYNTTNRHPRKYSKEIDDALRKILQDEITKTELLGSSHKQALSHKQIYELIVAQGFDIGLSTINTKINEIRNEKKEVFIKQVYDYGDRFEYDFGEVKLIIDGRAEKYSLAVLSAPASNFKWAYLYTNQKMEVFLDSQIRFFEMLGGCFKEGVYDNMRNVVSKFIGRNEKELNEQLIKLSLYYGFDINVTNCFSGNEKGNVENAVKWIRNKVFALEYQFDSFESAQQHLQNKLKEINEVSNIEEEKKHLTPYRPKYESAIIDTYTVDKYALIHVDNNEYSVPEDLCEKKVRVKVYPNDITVIYQGVEVVTHVRHYTKKKTYIDIRHYLHTFTTKPGALRNSAALKCYPELKSLFDLYYKEKPKTFIELLRANAYLDDQELIEAMKPNNNIIEKLKDKVEDSTANQIKQITTMFTGGGNNLVN